VVVVGASVVVVVLVVVEVVVLVELVVVVEVVVSVPLPVPHADTSNPKQTASAAIRRTVQALSLLS
jgi:hypothetical protein